MKKVLFMPVLAAVLFAAACEGDPTRSDTRPSVRFFNATTGMAGSGGFTTNGQFATGSALALGQSSPTCSKVDPGSMSFGFGTANTGGTGLSGEALATLSNQSITAGGNYTVVATGSAASPQLYLLDNSFAFPLASNQAAVRFVNLAPGPNPVPYAFYVFARELPPAGAVLESQVQVGSPTTFRSVTSGPNAFMVMAGHLLETRTDATLDLQARTGNTVAIVTSATPSGFQLINIPEC